MTMRCMRIQITILLLLVLLTNNQSECLSLPDNGSSTHHHQQQHQQQLTTSPSQNHQKQQHVNCHPALLNAISNFSPSTSSSKRTVDACRIFHGRGGSYPGADHLTLDYYPPVFLLTSFQHYFSEDELDVYGNALGKLWDDQLSSDSLESTTIINKEEEDDGHPNNNPTIPSALPLTWVYQCRAEKGKTTTQLMSGQIPNPHIVTENNGQNKYVVHLAKGQNHGLFLDMASGRLWLQNKCTSGEIATVLNLFAYTCAFSIAALNTKNNGNGLGGATSQVVNVDMSHGALRIGQRNHELNGIAKGSAKFLGHDLFKSWGKLKRLGPYDCVVIDPPSYQKGSFVATKDYVKVIRRLPSLLNPEGWALLCLNAPELDTDFLLRQVEDSGIASELCFVERLENPVAFASDLPERELKVLAFQYRPTAAAE